MTQTNSGTAPRRVWAPALVQTGWSAKYRGEPGSIAAARDLARDFLGQLSHRGTTPLTDRIVGDVLLVVSELVTNATRYAPGPCTLDLSCFGDAIEVTVHDGSPVSPRRLDPAPARIGGHGMEIVARLCSLVAVARTADGKRVCARIDLPPADR